MSNPKRSKIIAGNWKMHKNRAEAKALAEAIGQGTKGEKDLPIVVLFPPFTSIATVADAIKDTPVNLGAQNMDHHASGAFTGEISPTMLIDLGVEYILIGHSERREFFCETNASVNLKLKAALKHGLKPIVCVGESLDERENNLTDAVVRRQVGAALADLEVSDLATLIVAYEPVWAIGTGKSCEAAEANRVCALIRATINDCFRSDESAEAGDLVPILYGGSVKPSTIDEQLEQSDLDGALVGGASLTADDFLPLIKSAQKRIRSLVKI
jgi:triosephosphate isomerase (TIM)